MVHQTLRVLRDREGEYVRRGGGVWVEHVGLDGDELRCWEGGGLGGRMGHHERVCRLNLSLRDDGR